MTIINHDVAWKSPVDIHLKRNRLLTAAVLVALACSLLRPAAAGAQTVSVGNISGAAGTAVNLTVSFTPGASPVAGLDFELTIPASLSYVSTTTGAAATTAGKSANGSNPSSGIVKVLVFGLNQTPIGSGAVAIVRLNIAAGTPAGPLTVGLQNLTATDPDANRVTASGSGGSVTVTAPSDSTPPVLSAIASSAITQTSATITWTTNENADSQVQYGLSTSYGSSTARNASLVTSHSQSISGLTANTLYHYRVLSRDAAGNFASSSDYTFRTSAPADTTPPVISGVNSSGITRTGATISWNTNEAADSQVDYGTTASYGNSTALNDNRTTSHVQSLSGLTADTLYHYRIRSRDEDGNLALSGDFTFTTSADSDTTPPVISGVNSSGISKTGASIRWTTDEAADSQIEYGASAAYGRSSPLDSAMVTSHSQNLTGLTSDTLYHYRVMSRDAAGNLAVSGDFTFTTTTGPDTTPPVISDAGASSITGTTAVIRWKTNENADSQVDYGLTTSYESSSGLDGNLVMSHVVSLTGLVRDTVYHYRIRSRDSEGNLAVSGDLTFKTTDSIDTTAPGITGVAATPITTTGATIVWTTDEPADSLVEYGPDTDYGSTTPLDPTLSTSHSQALTGLTEETLYHYRVRSRDAAGNMAVSADYTFKTRGGSDTTPPVISGVSVINITGRSATIIWKTNEETDGQIEYGTSAAYGKSTALIPAMTTSHIATITGLNGKTLYHFRVKSMDAAGALGVSADATFTTTDDPGDMNPATTLYYPRLFSASTGGQPVADQEFIGLAIANLDGQQALLRFTAYSKDGVQLSGPDITNPAERTIDPNQQLALVDRQLFGSGLDGIDSMGWVRVESSVSKVAAFSMMFNGGVTELDGASAGNTPLTTFLYPGIGSQGFTKINIANPNPDPVNLTLTLVKSDGAELASATREIPANGALVADLFADIFTDAAPDSTGYVRVSSSAGVLPFELMGKPSQYIVGMNGLDAARSAATLFCPQYAVGGEWRTALTIINLDPRPGTVSLRFIRDDASQVGATRILPIAANGKIHIDDPAFFQSFIVEPGDALRTGYVEISGDGIRLTGSAVFGDPGQSTFAAALPLTTSLEQGVVYSHISSNDQYFTGLAILNPGAFDATVTIAIYNSDASLAMSRTVVIGRKQRISQMLEQIFPEMEGQQRTSGYFTVVADQPLASFALFGTRNLSALSAIPPQTVK